MKKAMTVTRTRKDVVTSEFQQCAQLARDYEKEENLPAARWNEIPRSMRP